MFTPAFIALTIALAPTAVPPQHAPLQQLAALPASNTQEQATVIQARNRAAARSARQIPAQWQAFADCVSQRESHHNYRALNKGSLAAGRWQFLPSWNHGLPYMVAKRLKAHGYSPASARRLVAAMQRLPINKWRGVYQDIGFVAALTSPAGQGWRHWSLPGHRCQSLVPPNQR